MRISTQLTIGIAVIFAIICFGVAITGFSSLGDISDPVRAADGRGFTWFWAFPGFIATAFGTLGWWLLRTQKDGDDA